MILIMVIIVWNRKWYKIREWSMEQKQFKLAKAIYIFRNFMIKTLSARKTLSLLRFFLTFQIVSQILMSNKDNPSNTKCSFQIISYPNLSDYMWKYWLPAFSNHQLIVIHHICLGLISEENPKNHSLKIYDTWGSKAT